MIREALEFLYRQAADRAAELEPYYQLEDGRQFFTDGDKPITPPRAPFLAFSTLDGLARYLEDGLEEHVHGRLLRVASPRRVELLSLEYGPDRTRDLIAVAEPITGDKFPFGRYLDPEDFMIKALSMFERTDDLDQILLLLGNLQGEAVRSSSDDGVTQIVTVKKGVKVQDVAVKNPVELRPFRTFPDVQQPASAYVFRLTGGEDEELPKVGLWEVDDAQWQVRSIEGIKLFFEGALQDTKVPVYA